MLLWVFVVFLGGGVTRMSSFVYILHMTLEMSTHNISLALGIGTFILASSIDFICKEQIQKTLKNMS